MEVIILAGGLGTRLRSVVSDRPKCLAPVAGRPFLDYLLGYLKGEGVTRVVFSTGHLHGLIQEHVNSLALPFETAFAIEDSPLGTGGAIKYALSLCREEKVYVINGDTFFPVSLATLSGDAPIDIALSIIEESSRYGTVTLDGARITAFEEKHFCHKGLINGGVYAIDRLALNLDSMPQKFSFEKDLLEPLALRGEIEGAVFQNYFIDIGIPEDYERAQRELPEWERTKRASEAILQSGKRFLFLDRDGVINRKIEGDYVRRKEQFSFLPGVLDEFPKWAAAFERIVIVTNQRGVGRGIMTGEDLSRIHAHMMAEIMEAGGRVDAIFVCPATDDSDPRRKPSPGMYFDARGLFPEITAGESIMLGDGDCDLGFAAAAGMAFIRLQ